MILHSEKEVRWAIEEYIFELEKPLRELNRKVRAKWSPRTPISSLTSSIDLRTSGTGVRGAICPWHYL